MNVPPDFIRGYDIILLFLPLPVSARDFKITTDTVSPVLMGGTPMARSPKTTY